MFNQVTLLAVQRYFKLSISVWVVSFTLVACASSSAAKRYGTPTSTGAREIEAIERDIVSTSEEKETAIPESRSELKAMSAGQMERLELEINKYLGTPYQFGGEKFTGMDCSGFVMKVFTDALNIKLPRNSHEIAARGKTIQKSNLRFGDLVFFKIKSKRISHVGIYIGDDEFVHSSTSRGVIVSRLSEAYYKKYYHSARRYFTVK